jgi:hypothetical protein
LTPHFPHWPFPLFPYLILPPISHPWLFPHFPSPFPHPWPLPLLSTLDPFPSFHPWPLLLWSNHNPYSISSTLNLNTSSKVVWLSCVTCIPNRQSMVRCTKEDGSLQHVSLHW